MRAFPEEFRRDVVEIAGNSREPRKKIAEDFGIRSRSFSNYFLDSYFELHGRFLRLGYPSGRQKP